MEIFSRDKFSGIGRPKLGAESVMWRVRRLGRSSLISRSGDVVWAEKVRSAKGIREGWGSIIHALAFDACHGGEDAVQQRKSNVRGDG
jgi:hypothetical protein